MQIQNPIVAQLARDQATLSVSEGYPNNLLPNVQAVMDVTPDFHRISNVGGSVTAAGTVFTVKADRDFYLTSACMSGAKTAADSGTALSLTASIGGQTFTLISVISVTLTAREEVITQSWFNPIKVDRGTNITLSAGGTWTAVRAQVQGFEVAVS